MKLLDTFFGKKICVAISGGVDSTALLHYLKNYQEQGGYLLSAVHCEHGIRGEESLQDQAFVQALCREWGITLYTFSCDCPKKAKEEKKSLETAARDFRRECFSSLIDEGKADYVATAHHLFDEAETVLFRLSRGTSLAGAAGIKEREGYFVRPFLSWKKEKILSYAKQNTLSYRVDSTNLVADATRNKLRLEVFPALENAVAGATENLAKFAFRAAEDDALLQELALQLFKEKDGKPFVELCQHKPLFTRACLAAIKSLGVTHDYTSVHLDCVFALQNLENGSRLNLPSGVVARKQREGIAFFIPTLSLLAPKMSAPFEKGVFDGGRYAVNVDVLPPNAQEIEWKSLRVDASKIPEDAVFRFRKEGDWIQTFGGKKTLKKFLNERRVPTEERAFLPLIASQTDGEVYVICGVEISQNVKVDEESRETMYISLRKNQE